MDLFNERVMRMYYRDGVKINSEARALFEECTIGAADNNYHEYCMAIECEDGKPAWFVDDRVEGEDD